MGKDSVVLQFVNQQSNTCQRRVIGDAGKATNRVGEAIDPNDQTASTETPGRSHDIRLALHVDKFIEHVGQSEHAHGGAAARHQHAHRLPHDEPVDRLRQRRVLVDRLRDRTHDPLNLDLARAAKRPDELNAAIKGWLRAVAADEDPLKDLGDATADRCLRAAWLIQAGKPLPALSSGTLRIVWSSAIFRCAGRKSG